MAVKFEVCPEDVQEQCRECMERVHPRLVRFGVRVICVFASNEDKNGMPRPAVKLHGWPAYAVIRVTPERDRAIGVPDAVITIDKHRWYGMSDAHQAALIDHELTHLCADDGEDGETELTLQKHDWQLSGFADVVKRHGAASIEFYEMTRFKASENGQLVFGFNDPERLDEGVRIEVSMGGKSVETTAGELRMIAGGR